MTQRTDPRLVSGALSMVLLERWGLKANFVELVRLLTFDAGGDWAEISRREACDWLHTGPNQVRRLVDELVAERVLERRHVGGRVGDFFRFRDPRDWRRVPWRFRDAAPTDRVPQLVRLRLDEQARPVAPSADKAVVVLFDASGRPAKRTVVSGQPRRRIRRLADLHPLTYESDTELINDAGSDCACGDTTNDDRPTTTSGQATGSAVARGGDEERGVAGSAGDGSISLTGAAEEVRKAIVRCGVGAVRGKLMVRLAKAFADVPVDLLGPVLAAMPRAAAGGALPPALVDLAIDMIDAGAASLPPAQVGRRPEVVLAELYDQEDALRRDLADAEADGDEGAAEYFRKALGTCQDRIARITGEEATG